MAWQVWGQDGELAFEFIEGAKHVVVTFEDGKLSYAIRRGDTFEPGAFDDPRDIATEINLAIA